jgi:hypothetical protein
MKWSESNDLGFLVINIGIHEQFAAKEIVGGGKKHSIGINLQYSYDRV